MPEGLGRRRPLLRPDGGQRLQLACLVRLRARRAVQLRAPLGDTAVHPHRPGRVTGPFDLLRGGQQVLHALVPALVPERQLAGERGIALPRDGGQQVVPAERVLRRPQHPGVGPQRGGGVAALLLPVAHVAQQLQGGLDLPGGLGRAVLLVVAARRLLVPPGPPVPVRELVPGQRGVRVIGALDGHPVGEKPLEHPDGTFRIAGLAGPVGQLVT
ncbi:hypothetical protein [Streptomyces sp. NPDC003299]